MPDTTLGISSGAARLGRESHGLSWQPAKIIRGASVALMVGCRTRVGVFMLIDIPELTSRRTAGNEEG